MIVAQTLTDQDADDPSQVGPLLDQINDPIIQVTADGAYDGAPTYQTIAAHGDEIEVVIPPRSPFGDDCRTRPPGLANCDGLWPAVLGRNDNGPLQDPDRAPVARPRLR